MMPKPTIIGITEYPVTVCSSGTQKMCGCVRLSCYVLPHMGLVSLSGIILPQIFVQCKSRTSMGAFQLGGELGTWQINLRLQLRQVALRRLDLNRRSTCCRQVGFVPLLRRIDSPDKTCPQTEIPVIHITMGSMFCSPPLVRPKQSGGARSSDS